MKKIQKTNTFINISHFLCYTFMISALLASCNPKTSNNDQSLTDTANAKKDLYSTYDEAEQVNFKKTPVNDTIALGFVLGESKMEALNNLKRLTEEKRIIKYTADVKTQLEKQGFKDIPDYVYRMILDDTVSVELSLDLGFDNEKLSALFLTSYGSPTGSFDKDFTNFLSFMVKRFGSSQLLTTDSSSGVETHYWFDGYKQISIYNVTRYTFYYRLTYTDLRAKVAKRKQRQLSDSLSILEDAQKRNKEKEQQQDDIK